MERIAVKYSLAMIRQTVTKVTKYLTENGINQTVANIDGIVTPEYIRVGYERMYFAVGVAQKKWSDQDAEDRLKPKSKSLSFKDDRRDSEILRNLVNPPETSTPTFGISFRNPLWLQRLKQIANGLEVTKRIISVTETLKKQIKKSLVDSQQRFVSVSKIARQLFNDVNGEFSIDKARQIARTEVTYISSIAAEQSANEVVEEVGIELEKIWIRILDDRLRDTHRKVTRKRIGKDEKFKVGNSLMKYPGDPAGEAKELINCRCTCAWVPKEDSDDIVDQTHWEWQSTVERRRRIADALARNNQ